MTMETRGSYPEPQPDRLIAVETPKITRQRYVELTELAIRTVEWLEEQGLIRGEQCVFREIAERLWFLPDGRKRAIH